MEERDTFVATVISHTVTLELLLALVHATGFDAPAQVRVGAESVDVPTSVVPPQPRVEASHVIATPRSLLVMMPHSSIPPSSPTTSILNRLVDILPSPPPSYYKEEYMDYGSDGFGDLYDLPPLPSLLEFYPREEATSSSIDSSTAGGILSLLHALFCLLHLILM